MERIASFSVDHMQLEPGVYLSRSDEDAGTGCVTTTFDLRMTAPNREPVMDTAAVHAIEHLGATFLRNDAEWSDRTIYFGPMGCQTGFYLLVRNAVHADVIDVLRESLQKVIDHTGPVFGASRKECGNFASLDLKKAQDECARYLEVIKNWTENDLSYPHG